MQTLVPIHPLSLPLHTAKQLRDVVLRCGFPMLQYLQTHEPVQFAASLDTSVMLAACRCEASDALSILQFLLERGCPRPSRSELGRLRPEMRRDVMKWLEASGLLRKHHMG